MNNIYEKNETVHLASIYKALGYKRDLKTM